MAEPLPFTEVAALCAAEGLQACAVVPPPEELPADGLDRTLADGVGDMGYLALHRDLRLHPRLMLPEARSLLVALLAYEPAPAPAEGLRRARYAAGKDYHRLLRAKLARVGDAIAAAAGAPLRSRACVDSAPVNERTLALRAGLGWIGRNGLLIHPKRGSWHFIGCLFTEAELEHAHGGVGDDRCGSCRACESRCPTGALVGRRVLSTRCISYWTIEHHGVIPRALAERFQGWWFGCDLCQEVCPWNRFAPPAEDRRLRGDGDDEGRLLRIDAAGFDDAFAGRAVRRIGYERFRRNLLTACWSIGRRTACEAILREDLPLVRAQARELGLC